MRFLYIFYQLYLFLQPSVQRIQIDFSDEGMKLLKKGGWKKKQVIQTVKTIKGGI